MLNPFALAIGESVVSLQPTLQAVHAHSRRDQQRVIAELESAGLRTIWVGAQPFAREAELAEAIRALVGRQDEQRARAAL